MGVPEGWRPATLSELAEVRLGRQRSPSRAHGPNMRPYIRAANIGWGHLKLDDVKEMDFTPAEVETYGLLPGDILLNEASGSPTEVGKSVIYKGEIDDACFQNTVLRVRVDSERAVTEFVFQLLSQAALRGEFGDSSTGTNIQHIGRARLAAWPVQLPPLPEQRKIAAILSSVDEAIEKTQAVIDQVQVIKKGLMQELLTRGLPGRHSKFKQTEIGEIPEEWEVLEVQDLFGVQLGKMVSSRSRTGGDHFPYLRNINVYWDRLNLADIAQMAFDERERAKYRLLPGDLLACEGRFVGRCAIWDGSIPEMYYQKALHRIRALGSRMTTEFMKLVMMARFKYDDRFVAQNRHSSTIPHLPREKLLVLKVPLPGRAEQDEIVRVMNSIAELEAMNVRTLEQTALVKQSLMSVLLTGELRVTP